jgi:hypothetical protein
MIVREQCLGDSGGIVARDIGGPHGEVAAYTGNKSVHLSSEGIGMPLGVCLCWSGLFWVDRV